MPMQVVLCSWTQNHLMQLSALRPSHGDIFYLRSILQIQSARYFKDARQYNSKTFPTYQDAAMEMGIFAIDSEGNYALNEAIKNL
jgi:hypothetical protein